MLRPAGHLHGIWLPERSRIHRTGGPAAAGLAVAVGRDLRISADYNFNCAAKAIALVGLLVLAHWMSPGEVANWMERELISSRRTGNSITTPHLQFTSCNHFCQVPLCANPDQPLPDGQ